MGQEELVYYPKRQPLWLGAIGSGLVLGTSVAIMLTVDQVQYGVFRLPALIFGFIGSIAGILLVLLSTGRLVRTEALLTVHDGGLKFFLSQFAHGEIPWSQVKSYRLVKRGPRKFILIALREPQKFLNATSGLRRRRLRTNMRLFNTPFALPAHLFEDSAEDVIHAIRDRRPA